MSSTYSYPGVYIEEQPAEGPIQPVGTSTAGFIGPASDGEPNQPTLVTSFDEFKQNFGDNPMDGFYLWYAVRGFFENGGKLAYIVRASSGERASLSLDDSRSSGAQPTLIVETRELGVPSPAINVTVTHTSLLTVNAYRPEATVSQANGDRIQVSSATEAARFRLGDEIHIDDSTNDEEATIQQISGDLITLTNPLTDSYTSGTVHLADLTAGDQVVRLEQNASGLEQGSVIQVSQNGTGPEICVVSSVQAERISPTLVTYRVGLADGLANGYDRNPTTNAIQVQSQEFSITVAQTGTGSETRSNMSMARTHSRYVTTYLAGDPFTLATVREPSVPSNAPLAERLPEASGPTPLAGGANDVPQSLTLANYQDALDALRDVDEVNFIAIPDSTALGVQLALLSHCEQMADRFAIFDPPSGLSPTGPGSIRERVASLRSDRGFAALYYPWINVSHPDSGTVSVPPSGHVAGIYARSDAKRGVHKAPANFTLNGALGVVTDMNNETQGVLNLDGIDVLRVFPGKARPVVWGARTTSDQTAWQYVNIRRLLLFIEESIEEGIQWAVFEPNNQQLWEKLKRVINDFLTSVWRSGALFGETAERAFYVRIDETINPESERQLGRLYIEIGLRPVYPAEFVIVRIGLWSGGSEVTES